MAGYHSIHVTQKGFGLVVIHPEEQKYMESISSSQKNDRTNCSTRGKY